jgi:formyltetrahydrofolate deformylase
MDWEMRWWGESRRLAIFVSGHDHCLFDLLWRWRRGELDAEIVAVISNHPDLEERTITAGVGFHHVPVEHGAKERAEAAMLHPPDGKGRAVGAGSLHADTQWGLPASGGDAPAINIHHSFLPAFAGADPYRRAREPGVKADRRDPGPSSSCSVT